jgi:hypothetical protein
MSAQIIFIGEIQRQCKFALIACDAMQHNAFGEISGNVTSLTEKAVALNSLGRFDEAIANLDTL